MTDEPTPADDKDAIIARQEVRRTLAHEYVGGLRVAAYVNDVETPMGTVNSYCSHWSTPGKSAKNLRRLFDEETVFATIARLTEQVNTLTTSGICEVAAQNPQVMEYMRHWETRAEQAEAKLAEVTAELEAIKGRKVAAIINGDGPMTVQKSTIRKLVEERDTARSAGTFAQGIEAAAKLAETRHREWDRLGSSCLVDDDVSACADIANAIRALSPTPQADPVREAAAKWLRNNLPAEHDAWAKMQSAVDRGEDVGDIVNIFLDTLAQKEPSHD